MLYSFQFMTKPTTIKKKKKKDNLKLNFQGPKDKLDVEKAPR